MRKDTSFQGTLPSTADIQTVQPRLRIHGPILLVILFGAFLVAFFLEHGPNRIGYSSLALLALGGILYHLSKEYWLVHDRLTAVATVTYYGSTYKGSSRIIRFMMRKLSADIPIVKYSFIAFDQKTYTGETGFRVQGLYPTAKITVIYRAGKPFVNHPVTSFIFYSFQ